MDEIGINIKNHVNIINKAKNQAGCLCMQRIRSFMSNNQATLVVNGFFQCFPCFLRAAADFKRFNKMLGIFCLTGNTVGAIPAGGNFFSGLNLPDVLY